MRRACFLTPVSIKTMIANSHILYTFLPQISCGKNSEIMRNYTTYKWKRWRRKMIIRLWTRLWHWIWNNAHHIPCVIYIHFFFSFRCCFLVCSRGARHLIFIIHPLIFLSCQLFTCFYFRTLVILCSETMEINHLYSRSVSYSFFSIILLTPNPPKFHIEQLNGSIR